MKLLVGTPMYGGMCSGEYQRSCVQLTGMAKELGVDLSFCIILNNSLVHMARNTIATVALKNGFDYLLFIDADIHFNPEDVFRMIKADKPIIGGVYPKKTINWQMVSDAVKRGVPPDQLKHWSGNLVINLPEHLKDMPVNVNEPLQVTSLGTGFMLINVETLVKLSANVKEYYDPDHDQTMLEFFRSEIDPDTNMMMGEDYWFCQLATKHGVNIHAAPWVRLGHVGTYMFEGGAAPVGMAVSDVQGQETAKAQG
jgi:glycosyltransferase involved in cell wall biosynthesis